MISFNPPTYPIIITLHHANEETSLGTLTPYYLAHHPSKDGFEKAHHTKI